MKRCYPGYCGSQPACPEGTCRKADERAIWMSRDQRDALDDLLTELFANDRALISPLIADWDRATDS